MLRGMFLFRKHKKNLPKKIENTFLGRYLKYGLSILVSAWVFQGILHMNWREAFVKLLIDILLIMILVTLGIPFLISFFISHSLNFVLNGQFVALFTHMGLLNKTPDDFINTTTKIRQKLYVKPYLKLSLGYGSLSRGVYKPTSDLDLRLIPQSDEISRWKSVIYAVFLRTYALLKFYPLDLYVFDENELIRKMKKDELPIVFSDKKTLITELYPEVIYFNSFLQQFKKSNL